MGSTKYTIKPGDNLSTIASKYGTTVDAIAKANGISNPNRIYANSVITIPNATVSGALQDAINKGNVIDTDVMYNTESDAVTALGAKKSEAENAVATKGAEMSDFLKTWNESDQGKAYGKLIEGYLGRDDFSYDFNADALYQQYKDKYIQQGKLAMADAIGQASAMTGGYGNSYAATVGNQAYQGYLNQLNDVIPELYQMAYDRYNQKGQDMLNQIALLGTERDFGYGMLVDEYNRLVADRGYYGTQYGTERDWEYGLSRDRIEDIQWKANFDEVLRQFNEQMAWEQKVYNDEMALSLLTTYGGGNNTSGGNNSGGNNDGGSTYNNGSLSTSQVKALQKALGVTEDGLYGENSKKAAGGLSAEEAYKKFVGGVGYSDFDMNTYNKNSQANGGSHYSTVLSDLKEMKASGMSNTEAMNYLKECVGNSYITQSDYISLYNKYRDGKI